MIMTTCHDFWSLRWVICPVCPAQTRDITSSGWVRRDQLHIHLVPVLLGRGVRLFEDPGTDPIGWAAPEVTPSPRVTHLRYRRPSS